MDMRARASRILQALLALVAYGFGPVAQAADVFWVPISASQPLSFVQSGSYFNSSGGSGTWGPELLQAGFQAVNLQILTQHADWRMVHTDSRFTGIYLADTPAGVFKISDGNPATDSVYRYYADPEPWLYLTQPFEVGLPVAYSGRRNGQRLAPGGGFNVWNGTWSQTLTNLGQEFVDTPLGRFDALKLQMSSLTTTDTSSAFPASRGWATWDEIRWFVPGFGYVKVVGSGYNYSDFDSDGVVDSWLFEEQTMFAVPEPSRAWLLLAGLLGLAVRRRR